MYIVQKVTEVFEERNLRGIVEDVEKIVEKNKVYKQIMEEKDSGRPGHYYGRDIVLEGSVPFAAHLAAVDEFGGDMDWFKDDAKFQEYMRKHPAYNWLKR